jgi:hypothetical protein
MTGAAWPRKAPSSTAPPKSSLRLALSFSPNYREQWPIANLYPLLIHLNLFGTSYLSNILNTIQRF